MGSLAPEKANQGRAWAWRDLVHGLVHPSPPAIGIALLLNLIAFTGLAALLTPSFLSSRDAGLLAGTRTDYDALVTARTLALQRRSASEPLLVLLGGSTTRASLLESDLIEALRAGGREDVGVFKLCTSSQGLWETLALAEHLPKGATGVVVIGVGPTLFARGSDDLEQLARHPRLGLRSDTLDTEFHKRGLPVRPDSGIYFIDNAAYLLPRLDTLLENLVLGQATHYVDSRYVGMSAASPKAWRSVGERANARLALLDANWDGNLVLLKRVLAIIHSRTDLRVVLAETPVNPAFLEEYGRQELVARHRQRMSDFAREQGLDYVVLNEAASLVPAEFFDWAHLRERSASRRSVDEVMRSVHAALAAGRRQQSEEQGP